MGAQTADNYVKGHLAQDCACPIAIPPSDVRPDRYVPSQQMPLLFSKATDSNLAASNREFNQYHHNLGKPEGRSESAAS